MTHRALRVLVAPDSFKGSATAEEVAAALTEGWASVRPGDEVFVSPQADGGEGTADAIFASVPGAVWRTTAEVPGADGRPVRGGWLSLPDGTAVVELAQICGLPLLSCLDPGRATTRGLGEVLRAAIASGARGLTIALGGSASTDGGAGALQGLGARLLDEHGAELPGGGAALSRLHQVDLADLTCPPPGGVRLLADTAAVLTGPRGAAWVFGPQKGAGPGEVAELDAALARFATVLGSELPADSGAPGSGAAGGTAFGLAAWGGQILDGATYIAELTGLADSIRASDLVLTGEGCYDSTSGTGKLVGSVLGRCARSDIPAVVVAGRLAVAPPGPGIELTTLAGSAESAMTEPLRWLRAAGAHAARRFVPHLHGSPARAGSLRSQVQDRVVLTRESRDH